MFPTDLRQRGFVASNGEIGWTREDAYLAIKILVEQRQAILGGELWWVPNLAPGGPNLIPQRHGADAVYAWETARPPGEDWSTFVAKSAERARQAVEQWPAPGELPESLDGRILYNLTWVGEKDRPIASGDAGGR